MTPDARERSVEGLGALLLQSLLVGALVGVVGAAFRAALEALARLPAWLVAESSSPIVVASACGAGMVALAVFAVRRFAPEAGGSGVQEMEGALEGERQIRWRRVLPVKFGGGVLGLAAGLALGREGPTIQMGGALGRMTADRLQLGDESAHRLVAAGAGAGLAAAFNAPLSGVLFVLEEMRGQFHYGVLSVQAVLIACVTADWVVRGLLGEGPVLELPSFAMPELRELGWYLIFGAGVGAFGRAFCVGMLRMLDVFDAIPAGLRVAAAALVGALTGALLVAHPEYAGGGYTTVADAFETRILPASLALLIAVRFAMTIVSYATGAPGGMFAPMIALGTLLGIGFGQAISSPSAGVFAVAGMAAIFAATVRAPLTGIALAAELTGDFSLILPIALASIGATLTVHALGGRPIYSVLLERTLAKSGGATAAPRSVLQSGV